MSQLKAGTPFDPSADDPGPAGFVRRHRIHSSLLIIVVLLITARPTVTGLVLGGVLAAGGECLRIWAAGVIGKVHKNRALADAGPYRRIRHPLYAGTFLIANGYALMNGRAWGVPLVSVAFCVAHGLAVRREEEQLADRHGDQYRAYQASVPAFVPSLSRRWNSTGADAFSWSRVLENREHHSVGAVMGISLVFVLVGLSQGFH